MSIYLQILQHQLESYLFLYFLLARRSLVGLVVRIRHSLLAHAYTWVFLRQPFLPPMLLGLRSL